MRVCERTFLTNVLCFAIVAIFLSSCKNSIDADEIEDASSSIVASVSTPSYPESFKPNDEEYPYAGIPRIVIETENRKAVVDRETEIPAKMQIWGDSTAESEIMDLTIRGRGNSSWKMPKKSYKIEFDKKQSMLGMPKDKDWALIANYVDKTLMRNYVSYRLSATLGAYYAPRCEFAELYLNQEYLGVYLLTETIKVGENRVNIPKNDNSYIVEVDGKYRDNEQVVFSDVLTNNGTGKAFRVHAPQNATETSLDTIRTHIQNFEYALKESSENLEEWIDVDESIKHYWVQEFTKNPDAEFHTSVYFTWVYDNKIKMGPVWDFDLAFGNHSNEVINQTDIWHIRSKYWYGYFFENKSYAQDVSQFWNRKRDLFVSVLDSLEMKKNYLANAATNNFKRWDVLSDSAWTNIWKNKRFNSYDEAVNNLKGWMTERIEWIDNQELF